MEEQKGRAAIYNTCMRAVTEISEDAVCCLQSAYDRETSIRAKDMLGAMLENLLTAKRRDSAICQSPGYPTIWVKFGEKYFPEWISLEIKRALGDATKKGYLRPSLVDPLTRYNPGDNTGEGVPNIEYQYIPEQKYIDFIISCKGCGAELGNAMKVFTTEQLKIDKDYEGLKRFVLETAIRAGGKPCPPLAIGIGIGGQMDVAAKLSRECISTRKWNDVNTDDLLARLEQELLESINSLGIGAAGIGGDTTCLAIKIAKAATHTAIAPVAINFHCWVARRAGVRLYYDGRIENIL